MNNNPLFRFAVAAVTAWLAFVPAAGAEEIPPVPEQPVQAPVEKSADAVVTPPSPGNAGGVQEKDVPMGFVETFGGYVRHREANVAGSGFDTGLTFTLMFSDYDQPLRFGFRGAIDYRDVSFDWFGTGASRQSLDALYSAEVDWFGFGEAVIPFGYIGLVITNEFARSDFLVDMDDEDAILYGFGIGWGGGVRYLVRDDVYFAFTLDARRTWGKVDSFRLSPMGGIGLSWK
ncbi:MAG: hypothetical protein AB1405_15245 [Bdellovibrionota bacterium]